MWIKLGLLGSSATLLYGLTQLFYLWFDWQPKLSEMLQAG